MGAEGLCDGDLSGGHRTAEARSGQSVVARVDCNILVNPAHPEFATVTTGLHEPVYWDARLFGA